MPTPSVLPPAPSGSPEHLPIAAALRALADGTQTAVSLLQRAHDNAVRVADLNPLAHADWALADRLAQALDEQRLRCGREGAAVPALLGIPLTIKDLFAVRGMPRRAGTRATLPLADEGESTLVTRLRNAGALIIAKTNMHEIALGATGENTWTGDVCNPWNPAHQAGGSSSGAAVCAATGIGLGSIGSDTGGSVRIPAAFCGVTGFKPSFGAIPLDNALYLSWTCDHAGPLAATVDDCVRLFEVMAGRSMAHGVTPRAARLGVPTTWLAGRLAPAVREQFDRSLAILRAAGAQIIDCPLPCLPQAWVCYSPIVRAEAATVHRAALANGGEGFSPSVLEPMQAGAKLSAVDYLVAMQTRQLVSDDLDRCLRDIDALVLPTTAVAAPLRGQVDVSVESGSMSVREAVLGQTLPFSMCGLPALTMPTGFDLGLPLGLSVVGSRQGDAALLALGRWVETTLAGAT